MNATMLDHVDSYWLVAALTLAFAAAIVNGFRQLAGSSTPSERKRRPGQSATAWLLGDAMASRCRFDLPGYRIACTHTAAEPDEWDVTVPPPLSAAGSSHLWLGRLGRLIFPDVVIRIPDIAIPAPPSEVWSILIDFERYGEWNGFHRRMQVVDRPGGIVGLRMTVELGPLLGIVVETNKVYYLDEKRHILVYGVRGDEGPSSMRVAWIEPAADGGCTFRSYDTIGGWPALLSRGHIRNEVWIGFNEQHQALRDRVLAATELVERESLPVERLAAVQRVPAELRCLPRLRPLHRVRGRPPSCRGPSSQLVWLLRAFGESVTV